MKSIIIILATLVLVLAGCAQLNDEVMCTEEYAPVCGVDGVTYSNRCVAEQQNNVEVAYEGECGSENALSVDRICTREYYPVCGADNVTYSNPCMAGDMRIIHAGECENSQQIIDEVFCTMEYAPVCGVDNVTYSNRCVAEQQNNVEVAYKGECGSAKNYSISGDLSAMDICEDLGGNWVEGFNECEYISPSDCELLGGVYYECESACRNDPDAEICTLQCVMVCKLD